MTDAQQPRTRDRCRDLLVAATLLLALAWLAGYLLIGAIYRGQAGELLNTIIVGQVTQPLAEYHRDFNRLFIPAAATVIAVLVLCNLLPLTARRVAWRWLGTHIHLLRHPAALFLYTGLFIVAGTVVSDLLRAKAPRVLPYYTAGETTLLDGPTSCPEYRCYELEIACDELGRRQRVSLKVGAPEAADEKGTILFFTGWLGNYWWDGDTTGVAEVSAEDLQIETQHRRILSDVQAAGYRTVQVRWEHGWFRAEPGLQENPPLLTCNPATVTRWVYDNLHAAGTERAYCAVGHSNGATAIGYMLSRYRMDELLSLAVMEAGPNWARLDYSCLISEAHPELFNSQSGRNTIDMAFGYPNDGNGPCARQRSNWYRVFRRTSLVNEDDWQYRYPNTMIALLLSRDDRTSASIHAGYYLEKLRQAGTPLLVAEYVPGDGHVPSGEPEGADRLTGLLLEQCRLHR